MKHGFIHAPYAQTYKIVRYTNFGTLTPPTLPRFRYMHTQYALGKWVYNA